MSLDLDDETLESLRGGQTQFDALAWSGWAERQVAYVREAGKRYAQTRAGKRKHSDSQRRYLSTPKGAEAQKRYRATPKAKATRAAADRRYQGRRRLERRRVIASMAALLLLAPRPP